MITVEGEASRRHWDALAATYDDAKARHAVYYGSLKQLVGDAVGPSHRGDVLDAGSGTGQVLAALAPTRGVGIDASERMVTEARRRHAGRSELEFRVADAAEAAAQGRFDAVVCADVLEHVADWPAVIDALTEACRDNGLLVLTTPNPVWALPLWVLEKLRLKMPEGPHRYVAAAALTRRLRERGFSIRRNETHLLLPARLLGLGPRLSRWAARLPILRRLGVIQLVVASRGAGESDEQP